MSVARAGTPGATRVCPHCRTSILESASVCPACRHHLRSGAGGKVAPAFSALQVEGSIRHPDAGEPWEYSVLLTIRNARGEEIGRHVVGVGALQGSDERTFTLSVDVFTPSGARLPVNA